MILTLILFLFVPISITLGWFCYKLVYRLNYISENMNELYVRLDEFDQHINFIYELELYYGDETLKNLIDRKSTRLNSSHVSESRMPSSA